MAMTDERMQALILYCRVEDTPEERALLQALYAAALAYLESAGVTLPEAGSTRAAQADLLLNLLVLDAYDRRVTTITGTIVAQNPAFRRLLNQLKLSDTGMRF